MSTLALNGTRISGQKVRDDNTSAVIAMANIVKSSLGPAGLDKMIVDQVGEVTITNDGATILKLIEAEHPAAKILAELSQLQDEEVGDGTTSVVLLASELLRRGNELTKQSIHPTTIISGFQLAKKAACKFLAENLSYRVETLGEDTLVHAAKTAMSSKIIGQAEDYFAQMTIKALKSVARESKNTPSLALPKKATQVFNIKDIGILKMRGDSFFDSCLVGGVAIARSRSLASFGMPPRVTNPRIAFIDFDLRKEKLPFAVKIVCDDPSQLDAIRAEEMAAVERRVDLILSSGATAILSGCAIDEFALDVISRRGVIALKSVPRAQLKRAARATGGRVLTSLATLDAKDSAEKIDASALGSASEISEKHVGDVGRLVVLHTNNSRGAQTLLLRGPNDYALDEVERSVHDVLCVLKRVMESRHVVVGGGAVEAALSVYLENFAETIGSREQLAVAEFAAALMVVPKTLAANGAHDAMTIVAELRAVHAATARGGEKKLRNVGLNLDTGALRDNLKAGVLEPALGKAKALKFATEAAVAVLRVDDAVKASPKAPPKQMRR